MNKYLVTGLIKEEPVSSLVDSPDIFSAVDLFDLPDKSVFLNKINNKTMHCRNSKHDIDILVTLIKRSK